MLDTRLSFQNSLVRQITVINLFILALLPISHRFGFIGFFAALFIIAFLFFQAIILPNRAFYLFFGIKLMFDSLWFLKGGFQLPGSVSVLELYLLSMVPLMLLGPKIRSGNLKKFNVLISFYLAWVLLAMILNFGTIDFNTLIRQSGILLGLIVGMKYIKKSEQFDLLIFCIFISTIIPIIASLLQLAPFFSNLPIFHYKMDYTRAIRYSGLYYDSGTIGMINLISFLCNIYLASSAKKSLLRKNYYLYFIPINFIVIIAGGTRSVLIATFIIFLIFIITQKKTNTLIFLVPIFLILFQFASPYLTRIFEKTKKEVTTQTSVKEMFQETDNRTMFTGRMGIWQDILAEVDRHSDFQRLFGTGISSNAHSTYFFLILQIGWIGMFAFVLIILYIFIKVYFIKKIGLLRLTALFALLIYIIIGFSLTTIMFTSFQWVIFLLIGSVLNINIHSISQRTKVFRSAI